MATTTTPQLEAWTGDFGDAYVARNQPDETVLQQRARTFGRILDRLGNAQPGSILEAGCNLGLNLRALRRVSRAELVGVEPNATARARLLADGVLPADRVLEGTLARLPVADGAVDLAFTCGVLIHVHPDDLAQACRELHRVARRHLLCIEYFAQKPEAIPYRGHEDLLFKRDFGGFWLDEFPALEVVDVGFLWKRTTGWDDATWWLFRKP